MLLISSLFSPHGLRDARSSRGGRGFRCHNRGEEVETKAMYSRRREASTGVVCAGSLPLCADPLIPPDIPLGRMGWGEMVVWREDEETAMSVCNRLAAAVVAAAGMATVGAARADVVSWTGTCGTINWAGCCVDGVPPPNCTYYNNWSNGFGTSCAGGCVAPPGPTDDAFVSVPAINIESGQAYVNSLSCLGSCTMIGTGFRAVTTATFGGLFTCGGYFGGGTITLNGGLLIPSAGGGLSGGSQVHIAGDGDLERQPLVVANLYLEDGSALIVDAGVTFDVTDDGGMAGGTGGGQFINNGVFRKTGGTGITQSACRSSTAGGGRIEVHTGKLAVSTGPGITSSVFGGTAEIAAGCELRFGGGTAANGLSPALACSTFWG